MAHKKKNEEVSIVATKQDSEVVTDLDVLIGENVVGNIYQGEDDRQLQVSYGNKQKGTAVSIEDAVQTILADYNLHQ